MEYDINPFVRLKVYIINGSSELVMKGMEKLIIVFNKREITNYSQFIEKLNEIYEDYGKVEKLTDKEGFNIIELNNLPINNIWNYLSNDNIIHVSLNDKKNKNQNNKNNNKNEGVSFNYNIPNNKNKDNIKSEKKKRNSFSKSSKNKNCNQFSSSSSSPPKENNNKNKYIFSSSSSSSSNLNSPPKKKVIYKNRKQISSSSSSSLSIKNKNKNDFSYSNKNSPKKKVIYKNSKQISLSSSSSSSSLLIKNNNKNKKNNKESPKKNSKNNISLNITNNKENNNNFKLLGKKRKDENNFRNNTTFKEIKNFNKNKKNQKKKNNTYENKNNINKKKNKNSNIKNNININYELIPSDKLDDIVFLQNSYPKLFNKGTNIKFKAQELLPNGIGVGDYHYGVVDDFNLENKSFLVKNCNSMNEKSFLLMYSTEDDLMCIDLKNLVEIWIENENKTSDVSENVNGNNYNVDIDEDLKKKFIKRQIEYYLSDDNYGKDNFLRSKEDENGYIPIDVIMSFNKIKMITTDKDLFVKALKENENENNLGEENQNKLYELNEDLTKIRKVNYMNFMKL